MPRHLAKNLAERIATVEKSLADWDETLASTGLAYAQRHMIETARFAALAHLSTLRKQAAALPAAKAGNGCSKCAGTGIIPQFRHVHKGSCFVCKGAGA